MPPLCLPPFSSPSSISYFLPLSLFVFLSASTFFLPSPTPTPFLFLPLHSLSSPKLIPPLSSFILSLFHLLRSPSSFSPTTTPSPNPHPSSSFASPSSAPFSLPLTHSNLPFPPSSLFSPLTLYPLCQAPKLMKYAKIDPIHHLPNTLLKSHFGHASLTYNNDDNTYKNKITMIAIFQSGKERPY